MLILDSLEGNYKLLSVARLCLGQKFQPNRFAIKTQDQEIRVGGPETLSHNEIAVTAFEVLGNKPKITYIPDWVRVVMLKLVRTLTGSTTYGPIEFF